MLLLSDPQEMRTAATERPLDVSDTENVLRLAIKEVLVCMSLLSYCRFQFHQSRYYVIHLFFIINATFLMKKTVDKTNALLRNVISDAARLDDKIEKEKQELVRNQKRLQTLMSMR